MSRIKQNKIPAHIDANNIMQIAVDQGVLENGFNWKLVRDSDTLKAKSKEVMWIEWDEAGRFKAKHEEPALGRSLLMSPFNQYFTWQLLLLPKSLLMKIIAYTSKLRIVIIL